MSFFGKIDFNSLSDTEKVLYHYMSSNIEKIPYMRIREVATESHTSASSVMRFIRKLGFGSYAEFKLSAKTQQPSNLSVLNSENLISPGTFASNTEFVLQQIAEKMLEAENVIFYGIGASGTICEYAARRFATLGINSFALIDNTYPVIAKLRNTTDNMIVILSISGATNEINEIVNGFRNLPDFTIVSITSNASSQLALMSDYVLDYHVEQWRINLYEDLTSQIPAMFLIEALSKTLYKLISKETL
ncbi:MurR/RpiR family transcriptional regulator [Tuanshanicoccus lijuaniae]|uniref:MurR/RpiR family transcriptional regulator n=1 Tax=Aerococcaceae bacterium zg-1292 TaxID=2774330 RepID=UPI001935F97A|nr:MurR/RpiR family transcriptional regulator [Aerococcaceae bacterium zg-1292]QQA37739.1 MurR/RpiR family transcriptional regulator [Aerococcaceae bacterium zg-1292]